MPTPSHPGVSRDGTGETPNHHVAYAWDGTRTGHKTLANAVKHAKFGYLRPRVSSTSLLVALEDGESDVALNLGFELHVDVEIHVETHGGCAFVVSLVVCLHRELLTIIVVGKFLDRVLSFDRLSSRYFQMIVDLAGRLGHWRW